MKLANLWEFFLSGGSSVRQYTGEVDAVAAAQAQASFKRFVPRRLSYRPPPGPMFAPPPLPRLEKPEPVPTVALFIGAAYAGAGAAASAEFRPAAVRAFAAAVAAKKPAVAAAVSVSHSARAEFRARRPAAKHMATRTFMPAAVISPKNASFSGQARFEDFLDKVRALDDELLEILEAA